MQWVHSGRRVLDALELDARLLIVGSIMGLLCANLFADAYHGLLHLTIVGVSLHFIVNDMLMSLFFATAGAEIREAVLPGRDRLAPHVGSGSLYGRKALVPIVATVGGMAGPMVVYYLLALWMGKTDIYMQGLAIPTATDIAFSAMVARAIFGKKHPVIPSLLAIAVADDFGGVMIIATFYPQGEMNLYWLLVSGVAVAVTLYCHYLERIGSLWVYAILGICSWVGFFYAGIHPALGLIPVVFCMPHALSDFGWFSATEDEESDALSRMKHLLKRPVAITLGVFGFVNAGVPLGGFGEATILVAAGLIIGKPLFIWLFGIGTVKLFGRWGLVLPDGVRGVDFLIMGSVAGIGFTVALFVSEAAYPPGSILDASKFGALLSLGSIIPALALSKLFRVQRIDVDTHIRL